MKNIEIVQTEYYDPFFFFPQSLDSKILQAVDVPMFKLASVTLQLHMLVCIFRWLGLQTYSCIQCPKALFECYVSDFTFDCTNIWKENNWFFFFKKKIDSYPYYFFCYYFKKKKRNGRGTHLFCFSLILWNCKSNYTSKLHKSLQFCVWKVSSAALNTNECSLSQQMW